MERPLLGANEKIFQGNEMKLPKFIKRIRISKKKKQERRMTANPERRKKKNSSFTAIKLPNGSFEDTDSKQRRRVYPKELVIAVPLRKLENGTQLYTVIAERRKELREKIKKGINKKSGNNSYSV